MQQLLIATKNPGKFNEIKAMLESLPFQIVDLASLGSALQDYDEIHESYDHNALGKAFHFHRLTGLPTVSDDSGIEVDALPDQLGVQTRRWGGAEVSDQTWLKGFMRRMKNIPENKRGARFICCAAISGIINGARVIQVFRGETRGLITVEIEAPLVSGVPLSSVFRPAGYDKVYSALPTHEKDRISHRGIAVLKLKEFLMNILQLEPCGHYL